MDIGGVGGEVLAADFECPDSCGERVGGVEADGGGRLVAGFRRHGSMGILGVWSLGACGWAVWGE